MEVISNQYWCHSCHHEFQTQLPNFLCPSCSSEFIELLEEDEPHPRTLLAQPAASQNRGGDAGNRVIVQVVSRGNSQHPLLGAARRGMPLSLDDPIAGLPNIQALLANLLQMPENQGAPPASTTEIDQLPEVPVSEIEETERNCPICQEDITETAKQLPCKHVYHAPCISQWLQMHNTCPSCRKSITDTSN